jgi:hypothetical protein
MREEGRPRPPAYRLLGEYVGAFLSALLVFVLLQVAGLIVVVLLALGAGWAGFHAWLGPLDWFEVSVHGTHSGALESFSLSTSLGGGALALAVALAVAALPSRTSRAFFTDWRLSWTPIALVSALAALGVILLGLPAVAQRLVPLPGRLLLAAAGVAALLAALAVCPLSWWRKRRAQAAPPPLPAGEVSSPR